MLRKSRLGICATTGTMAFSQLLSFVAATVLVQICPWSIAARSAMAEEAAQQKAGAASRRFVAPLSSEGYLWAPSLAPTPHNLSTAKLGYSVHDFRFSRNDVDASSILLGISGEYTFLGKLTVGADVPLLVSYDISSQWVDDSGVDFGNIRVHARYPVLGMPEHSLVLTPALRIWLPTNTFLTVEDDPFFGELEIIKQFAAFEPMMIAGLRLGPVSLVFDTGPRLFLVRDVDDFSFWAMDAVAGAVPISELDDLEFLLELNLLIGLDESDAPSADDVERAVPFALSAGARYHFGSFVAELALRFGLNDAEFYYGDFNIGLQVG